MTAPKRLAATAFKVKTGPAAVSISTFPPSFAPESITPYTVIANTERTCVISPPKQTLFLDV